MEAMGLAVERLDRRDLTRPFAAVYDVIVCEGAVSACPAAWTAALAPGGRLGLVERHGPVGRAALSWRRGDDGVGKSPLFDSTPPVLAGFEPKPSFAF
jgi:protein-L-isoaspartate(D-aspartate) O-methyltransferase